MTASILKKDNVFRCGDKVKIINPEIFVRCGYLHDYDYAEANLIKPSDRKLLEKLVGEPEGTGLYQKMFSQLVYCRLSRSSFGGPERKIFTKRDDSYLGLEGMVSNKRIVVTGTRHSGYSNSYESEPAYLEKQKHNIIITVSMIDVFDIICVEAKNLVKLL